MLLFFFSAQLSAFVYRSHTFVSHSHTLPESKPKKVSLMPSHPSALPNTAGVETEKTMVVPISSDKGLCGGINSTVVKYSKVLTGLSEEGETSMTIVGEKARGQLSKLYADSLKNVIVDLSKVPLT